MFILPILVLWLASILAINAYPMTNTTDLSPRFDKNELIATLYRNPGCGGTNNYHMYRWNLWKDTSCYYLEGQGRANLFVAIKLAIPAEVYHTDDCKFPEKMFPVGECHEFQSGQFASGVRPVARDP